MLNIEIINIKDEVIQELQLGDGIHSIGRVPENTIVLRDMKASRKHAEIKISSDGCFIKDKGSTSGTYVNNERFSEEEILDGDVVHIGDTKIYINFEKVEGTEISSEEVGRLLITFPPTASNVDLTKECTIIGRVPECDVQIVDKMMSRQHTKITREGNLYYIEDLKSANGTFVNDLQITKKPLRKDDLISIGSYKYKFALIDKKELAAIQAEMEAALNEEDDDDSPSFEEISAAAPTEELSYLEKRKEKRKEKQNEEYEDEEDGPKAKKSAFSWLLAAAILGGLSFLLVDYFVLGKWVFTSEKKSINPKIGNYTKSTKTSEEKKTTPGNDIQQVSFHEATEATKKAEEEKIRQEKERILLEELEKSEAENKKQVAENLQRGKRIQYVDYLLGNLEKTLMGLIKPTPTNPLQEVMQQYSIYEKEFLRAQKVINNEPMNGLAQIFSSSMRSKSQAQERVDKIQEIRETFAFSYDGSQLAPLDEIIAEERVSYVVKVLSDANNTLYRLANPRPTVPIQELMAQFNMLKGLIKEIETKIKDPQVEEISKVLEPRLKNAQDALERGTMLKNAAEQFPKNHDGHDLAGIDDLMPMFH